MKTNFFAQLKSPPPKKTLFKSAPMQRVFKEQETGKETNKEQRLRVFKEKETQTDLTFDYRSSKDETEVPNGFKNINGTVRRPREEVSPFVLQMRAETRLAMDAFYNPPEFTEADFQERMALMRKEEPQVVNNVDDSDEDGLFIWALEEAASATDVSAKK